MGTFSTSERPPLVLIVDDDEDTRDMYAMALGAVGFGTVVSSNGSEAFRRARESRPDLIVTDITLPKVDGWELIRRLKADGKTAKIPVVVVTGWADQATADLAVNCGAAEVLTKPCLPDELASEIGKILSAPNPKATTHPRRRSC